MKNKIFLYTNIGLAFAGLILTIIYNMLFLSSGREIPGGVLWIVLVSTIALLYLTLIFYEMKITHQIAILGTIAPVIIGIVFLIIQIVNPENGYYGIYMFFIPHIFIYLIMFINEIYSYINIYKNEKKQK